MDKLRAGIIGVEGYGAQVLRELGRIELFEIAAVADQNRELAQHLAERHQAQAYDDHRSLLVEAKLDVLFLALPTHLCGPCIQLAAQRAVHLFKQAPLARTVPEAVEWIKLVEKTGRAFHVGAPRRFLPGYLAAHQLLEEGRLGELYLVQAESFGAFPAPLGWRGDPLLAGGGVLLEQAYHLLDQVLWNAGPPEQVYALHADRGAKRALPPYRTEDTAVLTLKLAAGAIGSLVTSWLTGPPRERLAFFGVEGGLEVDPADLRLLDPRGELLEEKRFGPVDESWGVGQQLRHFADCLRDPHVRSVSTAREHLTNLAVVEAAYLSARTQLPESLKMLHTAAGVAG